MGLSKLQVNLITGAIDMTNLAVSDCTGALVGRNAVFMVSTEDVVDSQLFVEIANSKHVNIPVYYGKNRNIILGSISSLKFLALKQLMKAESFPENATLSYFL